MTDVFPRKITRSTKIYMKDGIIVKATPPNQSALEYSPNTQ